MSDVFGVEKVLMLVLFFNVCENKSCLIEVEQLFLRVNFVNPRGPN